MKHIFIIVYLLATSVCYGQDCNDIVKKTDEMRGETIFTSPVVNGAPKIVVAKAITEQSKATVLTFSNINNEPWNSNAQGLFIKFDDGSILRFPTAPIVVKNIGAKDGISSYFAVTTIVLNRYNIKRFTEHNIVQYKMEYKDIFVENEWGERMKNWISCVYNSK